ncbi:hypothetical protein ACQY0O_003764 [Thecaphora frezii]
MSTLPPAQSQISEKPSKNAVTSAVDPKLKEAEVDRKTRFYGVIRAFQEGRYPDNKQIDNTLKYTLANSPIDTSKLSDEGNKLIQDVREVIETARQMVLEKNSNEEFQNFLYATRKSDIASNVNVASPLSKDEAQKHRESAGEAFRALVTLFLRNGELRKIFEDLGYVGRDIFADGAVKAAEVSRPDEEKLAQVDQPGPENEFHDEVPGALKKRKAEQLQEQARTEGREQVNDVANAVDPNATQEQNHARLTDKANEKTNLLSSKIPQKHKDNFKEQSDKAQNYLKEKFPEERRQNFIFRLKKVVVECQRNPEYQDAIDYFLTLFEQYKGHASSVTQQTSQSAGNVRDEGNVATAESSFRTLIERFANGRPTQPILDAVDQLYADAKNDSELREWFQRLDQYIRRALLEPGFILKDEANTQARQLQESGKKFFVAADGRDRGKYACHKDRLFDEVTVFFKAMAEDRLNKKLGSNLTQLTRDLLLDAEGRLTFKSHLWKDVVQVILPDVLEHVGTVPLPRMEYSDYKTQNLVIENVDVALNNVLPNQIELDMHNYVKLSRFAKLDDARKHSLVLTLRQIQLDMRDVHFFYEKLSGFPKLRERGTADVFLGGKGLTVTVHIDAESPPRGQKPKHLFTVRSVRTHVDRLNFAIRESKHDLLVKLMRPLAVSLIKKTICKAINQGIRGALEDLDRKLFELRERAEHNKEIEGKGFGDAFRETFQKDKSVSDKESKGSFKFVTSKRQSMLPEYGHPDGWVNKLDERAEKARAQGHSNKAWYSPAFDLVGEVSDPHNTETSRNSAQYAGNGAGTTANIPPATSATTAATAGAAGAGIAAAAAHGAGQPGHTSTAYTNGTAAPNGVASGTSVSTGIAPGAIVSPAGTATGAGAGTGSSLPVGTGATVANGSASASNPYGAAIYYQDEPSTTKAAPAITNALPTTTTGVQLTL